MKNIQRISMILVFFGVLNGCASDLKVYDSNNNEAKGVPINVPQLVEITTVTSYKVAKGREKFKRFCVSEESSKFEVLPLGERFYVTFDSASLGDGEFSVEYNDKGLVKSITLNSKASAGVEQATALLSTVLPFLKAPKVAATTATTNKGLKGADEQAQNLKDKHCLKSGTKIKSIKKLEIQGLDVK